MVQRPDDPFDSDDDRDDDDLFGKKSERRARRPAVSDFVRRAIENTMGSVQSTGSVSRDALEFLLKQGDRGRREVFRIVAHEVGDFLRNVDVAGEVVKVLTSVQLEVSASVKFKPSDNPLKVAPTEDSEVSVHLSTPKERPPSVPPPPSTSVSPPPPVSIPPTEE
ncbi:MAG: hypothetical protein U1E65_23400 [Myxococcota bacterium]